MWNLKPEAWSRAGFWTQPPVAGWRSIGFASRIDCQHPGEHSLKLGTPGLTALLLTAIHSVNAVSFAPDASFTNEQKQVQADLAEC